MRQLITDTENKKRQLIDGVRVFEDGGWVLVAPDRMTASFGIFAEAESVPDVHGNVRLLKRWPIVVRRCGKRASPSASDC